MRLDLYGWNVLRGLFNSEAEPTSSSRLVLRVVLRLLVVFLALCLILVVLKRI